MIKQELQKAYLDYFNDYLTIDCYAEHNGLTIEQATALIRLGKDVHESIVEFNKAMKELTL